MNKAKKGVSDQIRSILIDFKHERVGLGDSMREIKKILYSTNSDFFFRGRIRNAIDREIILKDKRK